MMAIGCCRFSATKRWAEPSRFDGRTIAAGQGWNLLVIENHVVPDATNLTMLRLFTPYF
jgi:hypothetical protein